MRPTVTDAAVVLGYVDPDFFLGGRMRLEVELARNALARDVAGPLALAVEDAALAVLALLTETMAGAIEDITINQGIDPRQAVLIGGGGAAGLNSVAIARRLGCARVVFPDAGAALSAVGGLLSSLSDDYSELCFISAAAFDRLTANAVLDRLKARCEAFRARIGQAPHSAVQFSVEARYAQQIWEIKLPLPVPRFETDADVTRLCTEFHRLHRDIFAFDDPQAEIEFINWRAAISIQLRGEPVGRLGTDSVAPIYSSHSRQAVFAGLGARDTPIHRLEALVANVKYSGPGLVETPFTTIVIEPDGQFHRTVAGSLVVEAAPTERSMSS
jgi:N-methylhydantoinase A